MPKIKDKYIKFGQNAQETNDADIPSIYSPTVNFTPTQVGSEGNDKISAYLKGIDNEFGEILASLAVADYDLSVIYNGTDTSQVDAVEYIRSSVRFLRIDFTRTSGNITTQSVKYYDTDGITILTTITYNYTYSGNNLTSATRSLT